GSLVGGWPAMARAARPPAARARGRACSASREGLGAVTGPRGDRASPRPGPRADGDRGDRGGPRRPRGDVEGVRRAARDPRREDPRGGGRIVQHRLPAAARAEPIREARLPGGEKDREDEIVGDGLGGPRRARRAFLRARTGPRTRMARDLEAQGYVRGCAPRGELFEDL